MNHEFHEFSAMFPLMEGEDFDALVHDIKTHGQRELIVVLEGKILDGRNRYLACKKLGISPRIRTFQCIDGSPLDYVWSQNVARRHLSASQRSLAMAKKANFIEHGHVKSQRAKSDKQICSSPKSPIISITEAAKIANVSPRQMIRAKTVLAHGTQEQVEAIEKGKRTVWNVEEEIRVEKNWPSSSKTGYRIQIRGNKTLEQLGRELIKIESDGLTAEDAAKKGNISPATYRKLRDIINIYDFRKELPEQDAVLAERALKEANEYRQIQQAHASIKHIVDRVWGTGIRGNKRASRKTEDFDHAVSVIYYSSLAKIDLPHLSKERAEEVVSTLDEAVSNIKAIITQVKETYLNGKTAA